MILLLESTIKNENLRIKLSALIESIDTSKHSVSYPIEQVKSTCIHQINSRTFRIVIFIFIRCNVHINTIMPRKTVYSI